MNGGLGKIEWLVPLEARSAHCFVEGRGKRSLCGRHTRPDETYRAADNCRSCERELAAINADLARLAAWKP